MSNGKVFASALDTSSVHLRNKARKPSISVSPVSEIFTGSTDSKYDSNQVKSDPIRPQPRLFGRGIISDLWLKSRLLQNSRAPYTASSFRSQGEDRPTTLRNVWTAVQLLVLCAPTAARLCARGQPLSFFILLLDFLLDAILPLLSIVTYARLFDLVQDALLGVEVTTARIVSVAAIPLGFKVAREIWDFFLGQTESRVRERIITNFQELYLSRQLYTELSDLTDPYVKAIFYESEVMAGFAEWLNPAGNKSSGGPSTHIYSILRACSSVLEASFATILMAWTLRTTVSADPTAKPSLLFTALALAPMLIDAADRVLRLYQPEGKSPGASQELKAETALVTDLGRNGPYKQEVLMYSLQEFVLSRWRTLRQKRWEHKQEQQKLKPVITACHILHHIASIGLYVVIALFNNQLSVTLGSLRLYQSLNDRISGMVWTTTYHCKRAFQYVFVLAAFVLLTQMDPPAGHDTAGLVDGDHSKDKRHLGTARGPMRIEARNLCFSYPGTEAPILKDINLTIEPGQSIAIVGSNGGGKTTLIKVLMGLYKPSGTLLIDGVPSSDMSSAELHARSACLFQDFAKYSLTFAENVGLGQADLSLPALQDAIVKGGAEGVLAKVGLGGRLNTTDTPDYEASAPVSLTVSGGEQTSLDEEGIQAALIKGSSLSGGQWQRVALARAFMKAATADIVVFDEPSSALDPQAEADLFDRIHRLAHGADGHRATTIYVSHRFATVRSADKIAVLEQGTIVEFGSHDQLMALDGRYKELFEISARGFK